MKKHANPAWLFVTSTLPQAVLLAFLIGAPAGVAYAPAFAAAAGLMALGSAAYGIVCAVRKRSAALWYDFAELFAWAAYLTVFILNYAGISALAARAPAPEGISPIAVAAACLLPAMLHGLVCAILELTPAEKRQKIWPNILVLCGIPALWYFVALPLGLAPAVLGGGEFRQLPRFLENVALYAALVIAVTSLLAFLFFLIRTLLLAMRRNTKVWYGIKCFLLVVFPLAGLLLNNMLFQDSGGLFGDFSDPLFYIFALLNALFLLLPDAKSPNLRLLLFYARCVTLPYILYFLAVFLPLTPLAFVGILFFGLGLLMLSPMAFSVMHVRTLAVDFTELRKSFHPAFISAVLAAGLAVLPVGLVVSYSLDRGQLLQAVDYVYSTDYTAQPALGVDVPSIRRSLANARRNAAADRQNAFLSPGGTPYLSELYRAVAMDGREISASRENYLKRIFIGSDGRNAPVAAHAAEPGVTVRQISQHTGYDASMGCYRTWLDIELYCNDGDRREFAAEFDLPDGVWITDYYLDVGNERKAGLIADRRAATALYEEIVARGRDPGILYYTAANRVTLKVFPFMHGEVRRTGFELIHRGPVSLKIAGQSVAIGAEPLAGPALESGGMAYIPATVKKSLPRAERPARYCFIIDCSGNNAAGAAKEFAGRVERYIESHGISADTADVLLANYDIAGITPSADGHIEAGALPQQGGFYLDRAIKTTLVGAYEHNAGERPVVIVATDDMSKAVVSGMAGFEFMMPESGFYALDGEGGLTEYALADITSRGVGNVEPVPVLAWRAGDASTVYLADNGRDSVVPLPGAAPLAGQAAERTWPGALALHGMDLYAKLHPSGYPQLAYDMLKQSVSTGILTPATAYTVLETAEQEQILKQMQEAVMSSGNYQELSMELQDMPEPPLWLICLPLAAAAALKRKGWIKRRPRA